MKLVESQHLYKYIREYGYLQQDKTREIFMQIVAAMGYSCGHRIVHRELKPDNIILDKKAKVGNIDFGLSTKVHPEHC